MGKRFYLKNGWKLKKGKTHAETDFKKGGPVPEKWINAEVPGTVHTDLISSGLIPDPFYGDNEIGLQWIGETDWLYKTVFNFPDDFSEKEKTYLVFEGLDTVTEIFLNGNEIGRTFNMFNKFVFDITERVKKKGNILEIKFLSAYKYARTLEKKYGKLEVALNSERVYIRKAQYSFGWDWGPAFATCGIWRPAYLLQIPSYTVEELKFNTLNLSGNSAEVEASIKLNNKIPDDAKIKISLSIGNEIAAEATDGGKREYNFRFVIKNAKLWWPNNYGEQVLYDLKAAIISGDGNIIDEKEKKVGIRIINLILEENEKPQFKLEVNGKPVFAKGADWIPSDSFIPRIDDSKYEYLIRSAKEANMNILRVWGGGFYENDIFYELCDKMGLMVWQDFMFACAAYPENEDFLENVKDEAVQNINRLQHHPSIAIWCGNNENEWIWYRKYNKSYKEMPGYKIYHEILPALLKEIDPHRPYWPSSPFGNGDDPNSESSGNRHQWDIWSLWIDYSKVKFDQSLFVTEFGFQSSAGYETIKDVLPEDQRNAQSRLFEFHNKQIEGPERLFKFLSSHLPIRTELKDFVYLTQLNQGLALRECLSHWQYKFPYTNGAIIWQLNDCWPVASWSLIDSALRPKLSYYMVKNYFNPIQAYFDKVNSNLDIIVQNNGISKFIGSAEVKLLILPSGKMENVSVKKFSLQPLSKQNILNIKIPSGVEKGKGLFIVSVYNNEEIIESRNYYKEAEWKYLSLPEAKIETEFSTKKGILKLKTDKPAFFVHLRNSAADFSDNGFILLPDEEKKITVRIRDSKSFKKKFPFVTLNQFLLQGNKK